MNERTDERNDKRRLGVILISLVVVLALAIFFYNMYRDRVNPNTGEVSSTTMAQTEITTPSSADDEYGTLVAALATAPNISMQDAQGKTFTLADFKGTPVVLNFWYSGCPHCKKEMPAFAAAHKQYSDKVKFIMLNDVKAERNSDDGKKYIESSGFTFPVFYDTEGNAMNMYGLRAYPATIFIDANGKIVNKHIGEITEANLVQNIKTLLGE